MKARSSRKAATKICRTAGRRSWNSFLPMEAGDVEGVSIRRVYRGGAAAVLRGCVLDRQPAVSVLVDLSVERGVSDGRWADRRRAGPGRGRASGHGAACRAAQPARSEGPGGDGPEGGDARRDQERLDGRDPDGGTPRRPVPGNRLRVERFAEGGERGHDRGA